MTGEWVRYRRTEDRPLEAMHARFESHVYHAHSHDTYSFGVTETGAQQFTCRGARHTSSAGLVMAFNPDDPHDGWSANEGGFTYRMVHIGPELLADVAMRGLGQTGAAPLFARPVLDDPTVAAAVRRLHAALMGQSSTLERDERLAAALAALLRRASRPAHPVTGTAGGSRALAARVRDQLQAEQFSDLGADELAERVGHSRFAVYRAFRHTYGMSPSAYQRQLRLRAARDLLVAGRNPAQAAAEAGFVDQAHLTRWFVRSFGLTPGAFRRAASGRLAPPPPGGDGRDGA